MSRFFTPPALPGVCVWNICIDVKCCHAPVNHGDSLCLAWMRTKWRFLASRCREPQNICKGIKFPWRASSNKDRAKWMWHQCPASTDVPALYMFNAVGLYVKDSCDFDWCGMGLSQEPLSNMFSHWLKGFSSQRITYMIQFLYVLVKCVWEKIVTYIIMYDVNVLGIRQGWHCSRGTANSGQIAKQFKVTYS